MTEERDERAAPGSRADAEGPSWLELDRRHVWHPFSQARSEPPPVPIVRAEGVWLHTASGERIIDAISSWWVTLHGHVHPRLARAVAEQAATLEQVIFAGMTHEPASRLAARLVELAPAGLERVFFSDDGSTAVEVALKLAAQHWHQRGESERTIFVALENAYHGDTFGAMAAGGVSAYHGVFRPFLFDVARAPAPDPFAFDRRRDPSACVRSALRALDEILDAHRGRVAALIIEPMLQGAGGMIVWPDGYLAGARQLCDEHGTLLIADEVLTGFGRTGKLFACEHGPVSPDLLCLSKGLTGGFLPLGATLATEAIWSSFLGDDRSTAFLHGHSYTANPIACAVALESLRIIEEERVLDRVRAIESKLGERLSRARSLPLVADVRGIGAVAAIELDTPAGGYHDPIGQRLAKELLARGVLIRPLGNVVYVLPPYAITDEEIDLVFDRIEEAIQRLAAEA
ncbi:MAG TPA: adenosylmethionine--8-amino-7-oxononanoate transaminase [Planctomycetota bacterium]|nr:adenosylmethionine--8-amino-7-oxononanoate transaminase [Planctomycetota bacterium]